MSVSLRHVLEDKCSYEGCTTHNVLAEGSTFTERELAIFLAGAQEARDRFYYRPDAELQIGGKGYPTHRLDAVIESIRDDVITACERRNSQATSK